jgi:hypothetical protein
MARRRAGRRATRDVAQAIWPNPPWMHWAFVLLGLIVGVILETDLVIYTGSFLVYVQWLPTLLRTATCLIAVVVLIHMRHSRYCSYVTALYLGYQFTTHRRIGPNIEDGLRNLMWYNLPDDTLELNLWLAVLRIEVRVICFWVATGLVIVCSAIFTMCFIRSFSLPYPFGQKRALTEDDNTQQKQVANVFESPGKTRRGGLRARVQLGSCYASVWQRQSGNLRGEMLRIAHTLALEMENGKSPKEIEALRNTLSAESGAMMLQLQGSESKKVDVKRIIREAEACCKQLVWFVEDADSVPVFRPLSKQVSIRPIADALEVFEQRIRYRARQCIIEMLHEERSQKLKVWTKKETQRACRTCKFNKSEAQSVNDLASFLAKFFVNGWKILMECDDLKRITDEALGAADLYKGFYNYVHERMLKQQAGYSSVLQKAQELKKFQKEELAVCSCGSLAELFEVGSMAELRAAEFVEYVARESGGKSLAGSLKHGVRIIEKAGAVPQFFLGTSSLCLSRSLDVARGAVQMTRMVGIQAALGVIKAEHEAGHIQVARVKERFTCPSEGWRDILVNYVFTSGPAAWHPCEIQLVHQRMYTVRSGLGAHGAFGTFRTVLELSELVEKLAAEPAKARPPHLQKATEDLARLLPRKM